MEPTLDKMEDNLMQLTLQLRNRKDDDKKYAKFHGDSLIGVSANTSAICIVIEISAGSNPSARWLRWRFEGYIHKQELACAEESIQRACSQK